MSNKQQNTKAKGNEASLENDKQESKKNKPNHLLNNDLEKFIKLNSNSKTASIWRINQDNNANQKLAHRNREKLDTGFDQLNQLLTLNGWPLNGINELNLSQHGIGELRLLIPALQALETPTILLIAPPFLPFAPALRHYGFDVKHWLVAQSDSIQDRLWAAEQALLSDTCAAVLCWTGRQKLHHRELRRLQLASKKNHSWFVLLRDQSCIQSSSPASLRLHLENNAHGQLVIKLFKQIGGSAGQSCTLSLAPHYENWQRLAVHLWPQTNTEQMPSFKAKRQNSLKAKIERQSSNKKSLNKATVSVLSPLSALQNVQ